MSLHQPAAGLPGLHEHRVPKGKDGFGNNTYTEILARPQLQLDLGKMLL